MPRISESRYNIDLWSGNLSAGVVGNAPTVIDNNDGTFDLSGFQVMLYPNSINIGGLTLYTIEATLNYDVTAIPNEIAYVVCDYNGGTPIVDLLTFAELPLINESDIIPVATLYVEYSTETGLFLIHHLTWDGLGQGLGNKIHTRLVKTDRFRWESDASLSVTDPAKSVQLSAGVFWLGAVRHELDAFNSATVGHRFYHWFHAGTGATIDITSVVNGVTKTLGTIVDNTTGTLTDGVYEGLATTGGTGTGLIVDITVAGNTVTKVTVQYGDGGTGYIVTDAIQVAGNLITGGTGGTVDFQVATIADGVVDAVTVTSGVAGTKYYPDSHITVTGTGVGGDGELVIKVDTVGTAGDITGVSVVTGGSGYAATDDGLALYEGWIRLVYADGSGVYNNTHYCPTGGLSLLTDNYYTVNWVYRDLESDSHMGYILDDQEFETFGAALGSQPRLDLPPEFGVVSVLVGRIIVQNGQTIATSGTGLVEGAFDYTYLGSQTATHNNIAGKQGGQTLVDEFYHLDLEQKEYILHGIGSVATTISFDDVTHEFQITGTNWNYYYKGDYVEVPSAVTVNLNTVVTFPAQENYFIYFADTSATLTASITPWDLDEHVPVALVFWNSSTGTGTGAVFNERHGIRRNLEWHKWAHTTVNTRYLSGLEMVDPAGTPNNINIGGGSIADEDIIITIDPTTTGRIFYETAAGVWTFKDDVLPYYDTTPTGGSPEWPKTDAGTPYALTPLASGKYMPVWCYASPDIDEPLYFVCPSYTTVGYNSAALAREAPIPSTPFAQEMKIIYRFVYDDAGAIFYDASQDDFRSSSLLAGGGGTGTVSAAQTTFAPYGYISATNVQGAIQEIDDEQKAVRLDTVRTTTSETLTLVNAGQFIQFSNTGTVTFTIPDKSSVSFIVGTRIDLLNINTGQVNVTIPTDTLNSKGGLVGLVQGAHATLVKTGPTTWWLYGDLSA